MDNRSNYTEWKPYKGTWYRKAIQYDSSYKEKELQGEFTAKKIRYLREVQFKGLQTENGGWYRADFFLPDKDMIVEYDGDYHLLDYQKKVDQIKDKYYKRHVKIKEIIEGTELTYKEGKEILDNKILTIINKKGNPLIEDWD